MHNSNFLVKKCTAAKFQTQTFNINCGLEADINEYSLSRWGNREQQTLI